MEKKRSLGIIGGGPSGLIAFHVALRSARFRKIVLFERNPDPDAFGLGIWARSKNTAKSNMKNPSEIASPVWQTLRTNTYNDMLEVPRFSFNRFLKENPSIAESSIDFVNKFSSFPTHDFVAKYLRWYREYVEKERLQLNAENTEVKDDVANKFEIKIGVEVESVVENEVSAADNIDKETSSTGKKSTHSYIINNDTSSPFDSILVCNGHFDKINVPDDLEHYASEENIDFPNIIHAKKSATWSEQDFADFCGNKKSVIVVGSGPTGSDLYEKLRLGLFEGRFSNQIIEDRQLFWICSKAFGSSPVPAGDHSSTENNGTRNSTADNAKVFPGLDLSYNRIQMGDRNSIRLSHSEGASPDISLDIQDCAVLLCTGYQFDFPFLPEELQPTGISSGSSSSSGQNDGKTENKEIKQSKNKNNTGLISQRAGEFLNKNVSRLKSGMFLKGRENFGFINLHKGVPTPFTEMFFQSLAFVYKHDSVRIDEDLFLTDSFDFNWGKLHTNCFEQLMSLNYETVIRPCFHGKENTDNKDGGNSNNRTVLNPNFIKEMHAIAEDDRNHHYESIDDIKNEAENTHKINPNYETFEITAPEQEAIIAAYGGSTGISIGQIIDDINKGRIEVDKDRNSMNNNTTPENKCLCSESNFSDEDLNAVKFLLSDLLVKRAMTKQLNIVRGGSYRNLSRYRDDASVARMKGFRFCYKDLGT